MKPGEWKDLFWPGAENDPAFRSEIERLSKFGLRVIAGVSAAANAMGYSMWFIWNPEIPGWMAFSDLLAGAIMLSGVALTFWSKAAPHSRWICLVILAVVSADQLMSMLGQTDLPVDVIGFVPAMFAITLLLTLSALPVKPVHTFTLGLWMLGIYFWRSFGRTRLIQLSFEDAFPVTVMLIVLFTATVLTVVVYRQRVDAFQAKQSAEQSFHALQEAQSKLLISKNAASQSRLAAALAHELNTPLGALSSAFDMLASLPERRGDGDERVQGAANDAADAGRGALKRLGETVERMKRLTNLDRAELQNVDVNQLLHDTVTLMDDELAPRVRFEMNLESVPSIRARPQQLAAVFSNLVRNAAAAIDAKGEDGTIRVTTSLRAGEIVIAIADDGTGIDEEVVPHLFEPTFRAERGRVGTANWGLFTSRGIVTSHGGHIEIESERGVGTTARIRLPV